MNDIRDIIRSRRSSRGRFDPRRPVSSDELRQILEAARWAPTAHNMQNFDIIVVDDAATLASIGAVRSLPTETFIRENYRQLSFSEEELRRKGTGLLASMFPASWRNPEAKPEEVIDVQHGFLGTFMQNCPVLLIVTYDTRQRAPASEGDVLGLMSLGCVMQNMWLTAEALGLGMQILSALSAEAAEAELHRILALPSFLGIAFAARLGHEEPPSAAYLRVRRDARAFTHHNRYGMRELP
jgi:nitroreductase